MLFGLTAPQDTLSIKPFEIFKKEITLKAPYINPYTQQRAVNLIDWGKIDVQSMVYEKFLGLTFGKDTVLGAALLSVLVQVFTVVRHT